MLLRASVERPLATVLLLGVVTAALGAAATRLVPDDTPAAWLPEVDPELDAYRAFRDRFGEDAFLLAVTAPGDLGDPARLEALADLADRLRAVEGAGTVVAPVARGSKVEALRAALPGRLATLSRAVDLARAEGSTWADAAPDALALQAEANASLGLLLLHDVDRDAARACYRTAQQAAVRLLMRAAPSLGHALVSNEPLERLLPQLEAAPPAALAGAFWWAFARGAEVDSDPNDVGALADLPRVDAVMALLLERDEELFGGGPHLYFALRLAAPPSLGGDPEQSAEHFDEARRLSHGQDLLPWVLEAERLAPLLAATPAGAPVEEVLEARRRAWDRFEGHLRQVLLAPPDYDEVHPAANAVARARARALLADPAAHGVIPPDDHVVEALPPERAHLVDGPLERLLLSDDRRRAAVLVAPRPELQGTCRCGPPPQAPSRDCGAAAHENPTARDGPQPRASRLLRRPTGRAALVGRVEAALAGSPLGPFDVAGPEVMTHDLDRAAMTSFRTLFPLTFGLMVVVLGVALRSVRAVLAVQAGVGAAVLWTLGLMSLAGRTLNMVLVVLPAVLAVVGTAYALHLVSRYLDRDPDAPEAPGPAWQHAGRATALPCLLAALTTAGGFLSLAASEVPPVRDLGLFAAVGALVAFLLAFTLVPALLSLGAGRLRPGARPSRAWSPEAAAAHVRRLDRLALPALVLAAVAVAVGVHGASTLRVESDVLRFFPADHRLPAGAAAVEAAGIGLTPFELWLEGPTDLVLAPGTLAGLRVFLAEAALDPLVVRTTSPLEAPGLDDAPPALAGALLAAALEAGAAGPGLVRAGDAVALRATLACRTTLSSDACHALAARLREALPRAGLAPGLRVRLTGVVPLLVRVQVLLVETLTRSFCLSLAAVTLLLLVVLRSPGLALLSVVPNAVPVLLTLGAMGLAGLPLDTATVTVAAIALGLLVDDTIHVLHHLRARPAGATASAALARTLGLTGRPIVATTAAVALGFGAFALSPFRPTRDFGVLIAVTSVTALLCALVLVPALVLLVERLRGRGGLPPGGGST
ncbi:MAG: TRAP transporter TatT component family protein [Planctomycetes bacterium]|nr:TRAP transporter TatT component family protein [Planctomycetota bacterium]